jgi:hypothetical protein
MKLEFSQQAFEIHYISNFTRICPVGAKLFHADRQTHRKMDGQT